MTGLPQEIRDVLACPQCRGSLADLPPESAARDGAAAAAPLAAPGLMCATCRLLYPVAGGIPVLIVEAARPLD